jgi:hypothetical protein
MGQTTTTYYDLLGIQPTASAQRIRRAYRDLSKLYHPDTTELPAAVATEKFQALNEAYATLSSPDRRLAYDHSIGYSRITVVQAPAYLNRPASERSRYEGSNAYLDPTDRPLSAGELFALFILGVTFVGCLMLVVAIGFTQGIEVPVPPVARSPQPAPPLVQTAPPPPTAAPDQTAVDAATVAPTLRSEEPPRQAPDL